MASNPPIPLGVNASAVLPAGGAARILLKRPTVETLELGGLNFRHDRCVLTPPLSQGEIEATSGKDESRRPVEPLRAQDLPLSSQSVLRAAFELARDHAFDGRPRNSQPGKRVCVAGHTDASGSSAYNDGLSVDRALSVALYLKAGGRSAWAAHSFARAKDDDWQHVLTWVHLARGYYCNPRGIDGDFGARSTRALRAFRVAFSADFGQSLALDGARRVEDWEALYTVYDDALAGSLGCTREQLAELRHLFVFTDPAGLGCGERFPFADGAEAQRTPEEQAARDRRVEILFFDAEEVPDLAAQPPGQVVYGAGKFERLPIVAAPLPEPRQRAVVERLELGAGNFATGRAVLMPEAVPDDGAPAVSAGPTFELLFELVAQHPLKRILVAGHTDTKGSDASNDALSAERAVSVALYLSGQPNAWAEHAFAHQDAADYQRVLSWVASQKGATYACDPGKVDGKFGTNSKAALEKFKSAFNLEFPGLGLREDDERRAEDWLAFFVLYDQALAKLLEIESAELQQRRRELRFTEPAAIGCGERWPIEDVGADGKESARNRRVDILLFDEAEEPELLALPLGVLVYGVGRYGLQFPREELDSAVDVRLHDADAKPMPRAAYRIDAGGVVTRGVADADGFAKVLLVSCPERLSVEWGKSEDALEFRMDLFAECSEGEPEALAVPRLHNLGYDAVGRLADAVRAFQLDYQVDHLPAPIGLQGGKLPPATLTKLTAIWDAKDCDASMPGGALG
jgi:outer membrane protein OmpA-like peptidoglycan-associated protein